MRIIAEKQAKRIRYSSITLPSKADRIWQVVNCWPWVVDAIAIWVVLPDGLAYGGRNYICHDLI
ncbi:MAG: hypothetical protein WCK35_14450 [Chloroflexota bacterium]